MPAHLRSAKVLARLNFLRACARLAARSPKNFRPSFLIRRRGIRPSNKPCANAHRVRGGRSLSSTHASRQKALPRAVSPKTFRFRLCTCPFPRKNAAMRRSDPIVIRSPIRASRPFVLFSISPRRSILYVRPKRPLRPQSFQKILRSLLQPAAQALSAAKTHSASHFHWRRRYRRSTNAADRNTWRTFRSITQPFPSIRTQTLFYKTSLFVREKSVLLYAKNDEFKRPPKQNLVFIRHTSAKPGLAPKRQIDRQICF